MARYLVACDAGGTMTDVIIVDEEGRTVVGKALTTPGDESIGSMESLEEALRYMSSDLARDGREFCGNIQPLVPRRLTRGVTERVDLFGTVVIPIYEHEVERASPNGLPHARDSRAPTRPSIRPTPGPGAEGAASAIGGHRHQNLAWRRVRISPTFTRV